MTAEDTRWKIMAKFVEKENYLTALSRGYKKAVPRGRRKGFPAD